MKHGKSDRKLIKDAEQILRAWNESYMILTSRPRSLGGRMRYE